MCEAAAPGTKYRLGGFLAIKRRQNAKEQQKFPPAFRGGNVAHVGSSLTERARMDKPGGLVVLLLAERAPSEEPRSTRAFED